MKLIRTILALALFFTTSALFAQTSYKQAAEGNMIHIIGTSNLHDWELKSEKVKCNAKLFVEEGKITGIKSVTVTLLAETLKSGKSALDRNAYKYMSVSDDYPLISFIAFDMGENGEASGILQIAGGEEMEMEFPYEYEFKDGKLFITFDKEVTFSQFGLEAPSIMAGAIKTAEEVQLKLSIVLEEVEKS